MIGEIKNARQVPGEGKRRWFRDDDFDLIVWYGTQDIISGFQLCYDKHSREKCLTWRAKDGLRNFYQHDAIDDGETPGHSKMTPILVPDGIFKKERVSKLFERNSGKIDIDIAEFVLKKIREYEV